MSKIGVDARTYALMHARSYEQCLDLCRGDTIEAKALTAYYMRDWYIIGAPTQDELDEKHRGRHS